MPEPLKGLHASVKFEEITEFNWTDDKGQQKPIRNIVGLMDHGDGTVTRVQLGFPRDPRWRPPVSLTPGVTYLFPVTSSVNRKRGEVQYTLRTDIPPSESPLVG